MSTPLDEIRRLRAQVAEKDAQLAELRGLVSKHLEATGRDPEVGLERERAAFERGQQSPPGVTWKQAYDLGYDTGLGARTDTRALYYGMQRGFEDGYAERCRMVDELMEADKTTWIERQRQQKREAQERDAARLRAPKERGTEREAV